MRISVRSLPAVSTVLFLICTAASYAQNARPSGIVLRYTRKPPVDINTVQPFTADTVLTVRPAAPSAEASSTFANGPIFDAATTTGTGGTISGLTTVPTFAGAYAGQNSASASGFGNVFPFIMMGKDPLVGGSTMIPVKITEVSLTLLNANGTTFQTVNFTSTFEDVVTDSPNFANAVYDSSTTATQYADAIQRAEFFTTAKTSWHTMLGAPTIVNHVTLTVPKTVQVTFPDNKTKTVTAYFTSTASDGSTVVLLLDLLFNNLFGNQVVSDINAGHFTTSALNFELFPNTFLFSANEASPNTPGNCCVLGFHTYFFAKTTPQPRILTIFSSYISPNPSFAPFQDVTGLSHEISEAFNDPFGNNPTPVWQFPNQPANSKFCQNNLETGDPLEVLANPIFPITLTEGTTTLTFHPQTEALLQWFEMGTTSNAVGGAFSYPDKTALTKSAVPCPGT